MTLWRAGVILLFAAYSAAVTKPNCNPSLDIAVVIDETRSVSLSDLIIVLDAAKEMTELFFRRVEDIRFSIVSFAKEAAIRVRFSDPQDKESLKRKFVEMTSDTRTKPTRVDKALEKVNEAFSDPGNRVDSPDVMIIFTDGKTHGHETQLQRENANLMARNVYRVAIGLGTEVDQALLQSISDTFLLISSYYDLPGRINDILKGVCIPPVPGGYTEWSQWEKCSVTCGGGVQSRYRTCTSPPPSDGGLTCIEQNLGPAEEIRQCNQQNCPTPGGYTEWSHWGMCSVTCGGGVHRRYRTCTSPSPSDDGPTCIEQNLGPAEETQACNTGNCPIPGGYSEWSQWEQCNVTCGGGIQRRYRRCTNPPPSDGGSTCIEQDLGPAEAIQQCNQQNCPTPGGYTEWSHWGMCSVTCGGGVHRRYRTCTSPSPSDGGPTCIEQNLGPTEETQECNTGNCPIPGGYTEWSQWELCNVTCGGGIHRRYRTCTNPPPFGGGPSCIEQNLGPDEEDQECNNQDCPVPGGYTEWTEWQECSVTCGSGIRRRSRNCTNPSPSGGGATCTGGNLGPAEETQECNLPDCGIDGNYTNWSDWSNCSKDCEGLQGRYRLCIRPAPDGLGKNCSGNGSETKICGNTCQDAFPGVDLGILIDTSRSIGDKSLQRLRQRFLPRFFKRFRIGRKKTRVAVVTLNRKAKVVLNFKSRSSFKKDALIRNLQTIRLGKRFGTRLDKGFNKVHDSLFSRKSGDRVNYPDVLVVFTDGKQFPPIIPFKETLDHLRIHRAVHVLFVGYGPPRKINYKLLDAIAAPGQVMTLNGRRTIQKLRKAVEKIDGLYTPWSEWSVCSDTCGNGVQIRSRSCTAPPQRNGGMDCSQFGPPVEVKQCILGQCPRILPLLRNIPRSFQAKTGE